MREKNTTPSTDPLDGEAHVDERDPELLLTDERAGV